MTRGPAPKPVELKMLAGNPGKRKLPSVPMPDVKIPTIPAHLNGQAKTEWKRITVQLKNLGLIAEVDRAAVAAYCVLYARWVQAEKQLGKKGVGLTLVSDKGNVYQHPLLGIISNTLRLMKDYLTQFGLTPASRTRLNVQKQEEEGGDAAKVAKLLGA